MPDSTNWLIAEPRPWIVWVCPTCGVLRSIPENPSGVARCWCKMPSPLSNEPISQMDHSTLMRRVEVVSRERVAQILKAHYLIGVECDPVNKQDRPSCQCSLVDLGWHPSIGQAVDAWIAHVLEEFKP